MGKKLYFIFIILYSSLLLYWLFFGFGRTPNVEKTVQLVPFTTIYKMFTQAGDFKYFSVNIIGNIVVFIPFGFLGIVFEKLNPNSAIEKKEYFSILISNCVAVEKNKR